MSQRIRESWIQKHTGLTGVVEIDEIYICVKATNSKVSNCNLGLELREELL